MRTSTEAAAVHVACAGGLIAPVQTTGRALEIIGCSSNTPSAAARVACGGWANRPFANDKQSFKT